MDGMEVPVSSGRELLKWAEIAAQRPQFTERYCILLKLPDFVSRISFSLERGNVSFSLVIFTVTSTDLTYIGQKPYQISGSKLKIR
jgi:hypothetical protein